MTDDPTDTINTGLASSEHALVPLSRRRVMSTAAWTIPAITIAVATPAAATSPKIDGCIRIVGDQPSRVDCNLRCAPSCVQLIAISGSIPVGTPIRLDFDPSLIAVRFTDDNVDASAAGGTITGVLTRAVPEHTTLNLHIEITRSPSRGGAVRGYSGWRETRGWGWGTASAELAATLVLPGDSNAGNNVAVREITVR